MINYNKNKLINETLDKYYETFAHTLDTCDYVPEKYNDKVLRYIFKNLKKTFRKIDREDRKYQSKMRKNAILKQKMQRNAVKNAKLQENTTKRRQKHGFFHKKAQNNG